MQSHSKSVAQVRNLSTSPYQVFFLIIKKRHLNKRKGILQETTILHNMLPQLHNHLQTTSLSILCQRSLWGLLTIDDKQIASMRCLCVEVHEQSLREEEERNVINIIDIVCVFDLPEE